MRKDCSEESALCLLVDDVPHNTADDLQDITEDGDLDDHHSGWTSDSEPEYAYVSEEVKETEDSHSGIQHREGMVTEKLKFIAGGIKLEREIVDESVECLDKHRDNIQESEFLENKTNSVFTTDNKHKLDVRIVVDIDSNKIIKGRLETKNDRDAELTETKNEDRKPTENGTRRLTRKVCKDCGQTFTTNSTLMRHFRRFHTDLLQHFSCKLCKKKFIQKERLEKHLEVHEERYVCGIDDCTARFTHSHLLDNHQLASHTHHMDNNRPFLCGVCGQAFLRKSTLTCHTQRKHPQGDLMECSICHKTFTNRVGLREHMSLHKSGTKYVCELCGMAYKSRSGVYKHKASQHGIGQEPKSEKHRCAVCCKEFMRKSTLTHHMISNNHLTADPSMASRPVFECEVCGKKFGLKHKYTRHVETVHKKTVVCECLFCGKGFTEQSNYKQHLQLHTGNRPTCQVCKTAFRSQAALKRHMQEIHIEGTFIQEGDECSTPTEQTAALGSEQVLSANEVQAMSPMIHADQSVPYAAEETVKIVSDKNTEDKTITHIAEQMGTEDGRHSPRVVSYHVPRPVVLLPVGANQTMTELTSSSDICPDSVGTRSNYYY